MTERLPFHFSLSCIGEGNGNPLQCSCLENPRDGGAWWASVYGVAQSRTRLRRLSSSMSKFKSIRIYVHLNIYILPYYRQTDRQMTHTEKHTFHHLLGQEQGKLYFVLFSVTGQIVNIIVFWAIQSW